MNKSLIAVAAAALLGSGVAGADTFTLRVDGNKPANFVTVQDYGYRNPGWDDRRNPGWDNRRFDDDRRFSIDERQSRIHTRIRHGRETGALTRYEARQLLDELAAIELKERSYQSDGRLGGRERAELHGDLDRLAFNLRSQLRDEDRRG